MSRDRECPCCGQGVDGLTNYPKHDSPLNVAGPKDVLDQACSLVESVTFTTPSEPLPLAQALATIDVARTLRRLEAHLLRRHADPYEEQSKEQSKDDARPAWPCEKCENYQFVGPRKLCGFCAKVVENLKEKP